MTAVAMAPRALRDFPLRMDHVCGALDDQGDATLRVRGSRDAVEDSLQRSDRLGEIAARIRYADALAAYAVQAFELASMAADELRDQLQQAGDTARWFERETGTPLGTLVANDLAQRIGATPTDESLGLCVRTAGAMRGMAGSVATLRTYVGSLITGFPGREAARTGG